MTTRWLRVVLVLACVARLIAVGVRLPRPVQGDEGSYDSIAWNLATGNGYSVGAVTTADPDLAARCRRLRSHAQVQTYLHDEVGYNYRLNSFQGAVLSVKLRHLAAWTARRQALARAYDAALDGAAVRKPVVTPGHVFHLYVVRHENRDAFRKALLEQGVETAVHYPTPIHLQPVMKKFGCKEGDLPVTESIARTCVSLPLYPEMPDGDVTRVAEAVRAT
jgi:dTDP-4-amino-4,6-dideoxygalactose transaminase